MASIAQTSLRLLRSAAALPGVSPLVLPLRPIEVGVAVSREGRTGSPSSEKCVTVEAVDSP